MSSRSYTCKALAAGSAGLLLATAFTAAPAQAAGSKLIVNDDFSRSVSSGFGSAVVGGSYSIPHTNNTSVDGSQGVFDLKQGMTREASFGPNDLVDSDVVSEFGMSELPTSGSVFLGHRVRVDANGANYTTRIRITPNKSITIGMRQINSSGSQSSVGSDTTLPFSASAGKRIMMRSQVQGSTLRVKAWPAGTSEPTGWSRTSQVSGPNSRGGSGLWAYLGGGSNPINVTIDDLRVSSMGTPNVAPTAAFSSSVDDLAVGFNASASDDSDGSIESYSWDFGDGSIGSGKSPDKTYAAAGTYSVKLTVTDDEGATDSITRNVKVVASNVAPTAAFSETVTNLDASFDASGSDDPDGTIEKYAWDFGNGASGSGKTSGNTYSEPGTYDVTLTVTDDRGAEKSVTRQVTAVAPAPLSNEIVSDDFNRTVASGFGSSPTGTWRMIPNANHTSVNGSQGVFAMAQGMTRDAAVGQNDVVDSDVVSSFGMSSSPTSGSVYLGHRLRVDSSGASYTTRVRIMPDGSAVIGMRAVQSNGSQRSVGSDTTLPFTVPGSARIMLRSQVAGSTLRVKAWLQGTAEPTEWSRSAEASGATAGQTGVWSYLGGGTNAMNISIDDLKVTSPSTPNTAPTAGFTSSVNDLSVAFDASESVDSDGSVATYSWDFGDGSTGTGKSAEKSYNAAGSYTVTLTVTDDDGGTNSISHDVAAVAPNVAPTAAFTENVTDLDASFDAADSADSDGTIETYTWSFGDGASGGGKTPTHSYSAPGDYQVTLTVADNRGAATSVTRQLTAISPNVLPTAAFTEEVNDLDVSFDASSSTDSDGTLTTYDWDFGDGSSAQGKTATKTYDLAGSYDVTLTVTDNRGGTSRSTRNVTAIAPNVLPTAAFNKVVNDLDIAVDGGSSADSDGTIEDYTWDFGDGSAGSGKTVVKKYSIAGAYNVTLTVTDNRGGQATTTNQVTAITPNVLPTANFNSTVTDLAVTFDGGSSSDSDGTITNYSWDFGDGSTGSGQSVNKTYSAAGTYAVKLVVTDSRGGKATVIRQVVAIAPNLLPTAAFTESVTDLAAAFDASGSTDSDGTIATYAWDFGDGALGAGRTTSHTYGSAGAYNVTLIVTDNRGGTRLVTRQITTTAPAPTRPSAANTGVPVGTSLTVHNGDLTVTTPGAVIDGLDIRGFVSVRAPNVTIKRSIIRGGAAGTVGRGVLAITHSSATNFLVEDVTIVPTNPTPYLNGINVNQAGTVRRADISGTVDGIMIYGSGVRIEGSHLHDFRHYTNDPNWGGGGSHDDAIQVQGGTGIQIIGNTLKGAYNAGVMITQDAAVTKDLSINGNWIDGGGCSINYGSNGAYKTGMQANDNRFGRAQRNANCAIIHNALKSDLAPTGNVWDDNGAPATIKKGG